MITTACFLPHPPLLLAEYASLADPGADQRSRCLVALGELSDLAPERLVVLAGADRIPSPISTRAPLGLRVARELLARRPELPQPVELTVPFDADATEIAAAAVTLRAHVRDAATGVLVLGDGSARRGERAPGHLDQRSFGFDTVVADALATGDPGPLRSLDATVAGELLVAGRAAWQVLAAAVDRPAQVLSAQASDPFGVCYHVAVWRWR